jgi:CheY-like chemotaxis protein
MEKTVLIISEHPEKVSFFRKSLERSGCQITAARNWSELNSQFEHNRPDLVVLGDFARPPEGNGSHREIKNLCLRRGIPLIIASGLEEASSRPRDLSGRFAGSTVTEGKDFPRCRW